MKIGIEAQRIFRVAKHGMDVAALELIRRLQVLDTINEYYLLAADGPDQQCVAESPTFIRKILPGITYAGWEQFSLPRALKKYQPDIIHCTANTAPINCRPPLVLTLHDIIYLENNILKGSVYQNLGNIYRKIIVPPAVRKAKTIITVSEYERQVIVAAFPEAADKITVIYNGVDERFRPLSKAMTDHFRKQKGLPEAFILVLGNTAPKKNTAGVVRAFVQYCALSKDPVPIVITDYDKNKVVKLLLELNRSELIRLFIFPGYITMYQMPLLYNCCSLFLYPSLRESFGMPVLEAMACGVPVISSQTAAMPEIAGDAALLVNPTDAAGIAIKTDALLTDEPLRLYYIKKGLARASQFNWNHSAKQLLQVYLK